MVWAGLCVELGIIGPYYLPEKATFDSAFYRELLNSRVIPEIRQNAFPRGLDISDFIWQQDAASVHSTGALLLELRSGIL